MGWLTVGGTDDYTELVIRPDTPETTVDKLPGVHVKRGPRGEVVAVTVFDLPHEEYG